MEFNSGRVSTPHWSVADMFIITPTVTPTVTSSGRVSNPVIRYSNETFVPGSNNGYTAGRQCDQYARDYNGHR